MENQDTKTTTALVPQLVDRSVAQIVRRERMPLVFTPEQFAMIRNSFASGASEQEFGVLIEIAKAKRLNPLLGQIHFVKRWDNAKGCEVWATQTGIDGFRSIAEDTGVYDGQDEPEFGYNEKTGDLVWAKVKVWRKDIGRPFVGIAHFTEYAQYKSQKNGGGLTKMWAEKKHVMLAKCAEALAMRKAFPQDLGDIYTGDELGHDRETAADRLERQMDKGVGQVGQGQQQQLPKEGGSGDRFAYWSDRIAKASTTTELDEIARVLNEDKSIQGAPRKKLIDLYKDRYDVVRKAAPKKQACAACHLIDNHAAGCPNRDPAQPPPEDKAPPSEPTVEREPPEPGTDG